MSEIQIGPIRDIALGIYDGPHATPKEADDGPIFLGIKNVTPQGTLDFSDIRHISEADYPKWTKRVVPQEDDIVFSYEATLHRYAIIPKGFRGCLGRRMALIRPDKTKVHPRFLHYYFMTPAWRMVVESNVVSGATVDRIPLIRFPDFELRLPALLVQHRIASVLSTYDDLIENNRRRIRLLEQAARLLYREWFVHLRFPGHEKVKVTDGVPEGWERRTIGNITRLKYGRSLKKGDRVPGAYPVYGSSGVVGTHEKALVTGPGIILGRKGNIGSVFWSEGDFYFWSEGDFYPIDTVYYIDRRHCTMYLYWTLLNTQFINTDVAVPGLNRDFAHSRKLLIPHTASLTIFERHATAIQRQIDQLEKYNASLQRMRRLLLPRFMSDAIVFANI